MCSVPTEMRIKSSVTPLLIRSSSDSCSCVVVQGWIARVLESPTLWDCQSPDTRVVKERQGVTDFARLEISLKLSTTWLPAFAPPLTPNDNTPPKPRGRYFFASSWLWWLSRPG